MRFFRMAERRIVDKTGRGIVCFISNYSWLDGLSFTGMRERYLEVFGTIRIDCLNGDKYKTGKTAPDGKSDPSIFSTEHNREGIQVGTAIATLVRRPEHVAASVVGLRSLWGTEKRAVLLETAESKPKSLYKAVAPPMELGLPFVGASVAEHYFEWPKLSELFPVSFPGVTTSRDDFLVSIDREALEGRLADYFDPKVSHEDMRIKSPVVMSASGRFDPIVTRETLRKRGLLADNIVRTAYRPFDVRWLYWDPDTKLLDEKRVDYLEARAARSLEMIIPRAQRKEWSPPLVCRSVLDRNAMDGSAGAIPFKVHGKTNVSAVFAEDGEQTFTHCIAVLHSPTYFAENGGAMRIEEPHIPLPGDANLLRASAALGATLATLLDPETPAPGVSTGTLRAGLRTLGLPTKHDDTGLDGDDLNLTARWGSIQNAGGSRIVMPGRGLAAERAYTEAERTALAQEGKAIGLSLDEVLALLGYKTFDIHLNGDAWWSNVPARVWGYTLGGYQVIKKWLSYREHDVLGRALKPDEAAYVSEMVRRIAAILLMGPALDANYAASKVAAVEWKDGAPVEA
ncbi:MAG: type ISP restriction/modification enzyme [Hyphomicrobiaceae bacterium]